MAERPFEASVEIKVRGVGLPESYREYADAIENFRVRDDDVWICGFQKTGTTWTREMVWCIANNLDFEGAKVVLDQRCPWFESLAILPWKNLAKRHPEIKLSGCWDNSIEFTDNLPSPRYIKTHLPFQLLPRDLRERKTKAKIIYVTRNPKDACISYYHYRKTGLAFMETFDEFYNSFLEDKIYNTPFWDHVLNYVKNKEQFGDQMLIVKYADMKANIRAVIGELSEFLGKPPLSGDDLDKLLDHLSLEKMKKNPALNNEKWMERQRIWNNYEKAGEFIRCGEVGQWKTVLPEEISRKFDERTSSTFKSIDFNF